MIPRFAWIRRLLASAQCSQFIEDCPFLVVEHSSGRAELDRHFPRTLRKHEKVAADGELAGGAAGIERRPGLAAASHESHGTYQCRHIGRISFEFLLDSKPRGRSDIRRCVRVEHRFAYPRLDDCCEEDDGSTV